MASATLRGRVEKVVGYPPLVDMDDRQRRQHGIDGSLTEAGQRLQAWLDRQHGRAAG